MKARKKGSIHQKIQILRASYLIQMCIVFCSTLELLLPCYQAKVPTLRNYSYDNNYAELNTENTSQLQPYLIVQAHMLIGLFYYHNMVLLLTSLLFQEAVPQWQVLFLGLASSQTVTWVSLSMFQDRSWKLSLLGFNDLGRQNTLCANHLLCSRGPQMTNGTELNC